MRHRAFLLHPATQSTLLALVIATASACATTATRSADLEPCPGSVQLVVRNNTAHSVDVYRNEVGRPFVATVPPGTSHVPVGGQERGGGYLVFATPGSGQTAQFLGFGSRTRDNRFHVEERCVPGR